MTTSLPGCRAHGPGLDPAALVDRRLARITAAWHVYQGRLDPIPADLWLIDDRGEATRLASGTDWCLEVEASAPYDGYDMGEWGRIEVGPADADTAFAHHLGQPVLAAREEYEPRAGRMALELDFPDGTVRCESYAGELIVRAVFKGAP